MIDVDEQITTVRRTVGHRTFEAGEARTVTISRAYDTDIDDLWEACTTAERLPRWFLPVTGDLRVGGRYQLEGNAGGTIDSCDPPRSFSATWEFGDQITWIEVRLTEEGDGRTRLEIEHIAHVDERWGEFGPGAVGIGWDLAVAGLTIHLASGGAPVDPSEFQVWSGSAEGRRFITGSSDGWCEAAIADGDDPDAARAAADRTTAAYTG